MHLFPYTKKFYGILVFQPFFYQGQTTLNITHHIRDRNIILLITCCYRVLLPKLLLDVDKILYTDVDVIFNDDLQELDKIDVSKYYVAVAKYGYSQKNLKSKIWEQYGLFDIYDK
ncbi:MAG: hypothetical protein LE180_03060 [Endomicrobium sp.]|nr:hypothetical protein [Endomicrobium sp.]